MGTTFEENKPEFVIHQTSTHVLTVWKPLIHCQWHAKSCHRSGLCLCKYLGVFSLLSLTYLA